MGITGIVILVVLNAPTYLLLGWMFYGSWSGFVDAVWYFFTNSSEFKVEEQPAAMMNALKLCGYLFSIVVVVYAEYRLINYIAFP
jgi:hypothetical protein